MCTLTILRDERRTLVTMNRDEARVRGPEIPPRRHDPDRPGAPAWMSPIDSDSGGTWIGVNEHGLVACLLNRYAAGDDDPARLLPGVRSRGTIIPALMACDSEDAALECIHESLNPADFGSFTLVLVSRRATHAFEWAYGGGLESITLETPRGMITSSAFDTGEVLAWRRQRFDDWIANGAPFKGHLPAIHLDQPDGRQEWAILMDRPVSSTRSMTQVELQDRVTMRYWPRGPEGEISVTPACELQFRDSA